LKIEKLKNHSQKKYRKMCTVPRYVLKTRP